jgi:hypothetical protein
MKINFQKKYLIIASVFLVLSFFAFFFLYQKIGEIKRVTNQTELALKEEIQKQEKVKSLSVLMQSIEQEKISFESHFVKKSDIVSFLNSIEQLAEIVGANASITTVDENKEGTQLALSVSTEGSFDSIYKFLMLLENAPYEIEITGFDMKKVGGGGSVGSGADWNAIFKIKLLSFSQ